MYYIFFSIFCKDYVDLNKIAVYYPAMQKRIEIISDLDGTVYSTDNPLTSYIDENVEKFLLANSKIDKSKLDELEKKYPNVLDALKILGISRDLFYSSIYDQLEYYQYINEDPVLREILEDSIFSISIVSLSPLTHIEKIIDRMKIKPFIRNIYSLEKENYNNKEIIYQKIIKELNVSAQDVWVVGDNYDIDIVPAINLGCKPALIKKYSVNGVKSFTNLVAFLSYLRT